MIMNVTQRIDQMCWEADNYTALITSTVEVAGDLCIPYNLDEIIDCMCQMTQAIEQVNFRRFVEAADKLERINNELVDKINEERSSYLIKV